MRNCFSSASAFAFALTTASAWAANVTVPIDEVRTVTFGRSVNTVYVGNPSIADINMIDSRHGFVLGKAYGTTNVIALDSAGHQVANIPVSVAETRGTTVTMFRGAAQMTLSCGGPRCEVAPTPGDASYKDQLSDIVAHHDVGTKSASIQP
jgi:Flp pilus assembly secretin CpaC